MSAGSSIPENDGAAAFDRYGHTGRFFRERMLPGTAARLKRIRSGAASMLELPAEAF